MDLSDIHKQANQLIEQQAKQQDKIKELIDEQRSVALQQTLGTIQNQCTIPHSCQTMLNLPRLSPNIKDVEKIVQNTIPPQLVENHSLKQLQIDFFNQHVNDEVQPITPAFYSDIVEKQIVCAAQVPITSDKNLIVFLIQDNLQYLKLIQHLKTQFLFRLNYSKQVSDVQKCVTFEQQLQNESKNTFNLIEKLFSVANSGFIQIPHELIQKAIDAKVNVLSTKYKFITTEDVDRSIQHLSTQENYPNLMLSQLQFISLSRRKEIIQKTIQRASATEFHTPIISLNKYSLIDQIKQCKSFGVDQIDLSTNYNFDVQQVKMGEFDYIQKQCLENLENEDKIYGRPVTQEQKCSSLLQKAMFFFQSMANIIPDFAIDGLKKIDPNDALQVFLATDGGELQYKVNDIQLKKPDFLKFVKKNIQTVIGEEKVNLDDDLTLNLLFEKYAPRCEIHPEIQTVMNLIQAKSPSEREDLQNRYVKRNIDNKTDLAKNNSSLAGVTQLINTCEYVRFVDLNVTYADCVVEASKLIGLLNEFFNYCTFCIANKDPQAIFEDINEEKIDFRKKTVVVNSTVSSDLQQLIKHENFKQQYENNKLYHEFKRSQQNGFSFEQKYYIDDDVFDEQGNKVIFKQGLAMVENITKELSVALTVYVQNVIKTVKFNYIIHAILKGMDVDKNLDKNIVNLYKKSFEELQDMAPKCKLEMETINFQKYIDFPQIIHAAMSQELDLLKEKVKRFKCLFTSIQADPDEEKLGSIFNQIINMVQERPEFLTDFGKTKSIYEEQMQLYEKVKDQNRLEYSLSSAKSVCNPIVILENEVMSYKYVNACLQVLIDQEQSKQEQNLSETVDGNFPSFVDKNMQFYGYMDLSAIQNLISILNQTEIDIHQIFTNESYPKLLQSDTQMHNGQFRFQTYPSYSMRQKSALKFSIAEALIEELTFLIDKFKQQNTLIHENVKILGDQGLNQPNILIHFVNESITKLKLKSDSTLVSSEYKTQIAENKLSEIISLRMPGHGGISLQNEIGQTTRTLMMIDGFRDIYLVSDSQVQSAIDNLIPECMFDQYFGVSKLPLPFIIRARLINYIYCQKLMNKAMYEQHALVKAATRLNRAAHLPSISENIVLAFSRTKITIDSQKPDYRQILGPQSLTNNLPYLCTIDPWTARFMMQEFDPYDQSQMVRLLGDYSIQEVQALEQIGEKVLSFAEILIMQQSKYDQFSMFDAFVPGYLGVYARTAFVENAVNQVRLATLNNSIFGINFAILNQIIQGQICQSEVEEISPKYLLFDQNDFFKSGIERYEIFKNDQIKFQMNQSTLYFKNIEDFLYLTTMTIQTDYIAKIKSLNQKEVNDQITFGLIQSQVIMIQKYCVDEASKQASFSQCRAYISSVRTSLSKVNQDLQPISLENSPVFKYLSQQKSDSVQYGFFLGPTGAVEHVNSIPHPVLCILDQYTFCQLDQVLSFLHSLDVILKYCLLKNRLFGGDDFDAGERFQQITQYIFELSSITFENGLVQIPSFVYIENDEIAFLKRQTADTLDDAKVYIILKKSVALASILQTVYVAAVNKCQRMSAMKGLVIQEKQFKKLATKLNQNFPIFQDLIKMMENPFEKLQSVTKNRILQENIFSHFFQQRPEVQFKGSFECYDQLPLHQVQSILTEGKRPEKQEGFIGDLFVGKDFATFKEKDYIFCRQPPQTKNVQGLMLQLLFKIKYKNTTNAQFKVATDIQKQLISEINIDYKSRLGYGLQGGISDFSYFNPIIIGATSLSAVLTQIELDSVFINQQTKRNAKEIQNQWTNYMFQYQIAKVIIESEQTEKIMNKFNIKVTLDLISEETFKKASEQFIRQTQQLNPNSTMRQQQDAINQMNTKRQLFKTIAEQSLFSVLENSSLFDVMSEAHVKEILECQYFLRNLMVIRIKQRTNFILNQLLIMQIEENIKIMTQKLQFDKKLIQVQDPQAVLQDFYAQSAADKLQNYHKYDQFLSPFPPNAGTTLYQQIVGLLGSILCLPMKSEQQLQNEMVKIILKSHNKSHNQYIMILMTSLQLIYKNILYSKMFYTVKNQIGLIFDRHLLKFYGNMKKEPRMINQWNHMFQETQLSLEFNEIAQTLNQVYKEIKQIGADLNFTFNRESAKFNTFLQVHFKNNMLKNNFYLPQIENVQSLIEHKALAQLNPLILNEVQEIQRFQNTIFVEGNEMLQQENEERQRLHKLFQQKITSQIEAIIAEKKRTFIVKDQKSRVVRQAITDVRSDTVEIFQHVQKLNDFCKRDIDQIKLRFGSEQAILNYNEEKEPFIEQNQLVVMRYQQSIKDATSQLLQTKNAIQQIKALTSFQLVAKQNYFNDLLMQIKFQLSETSKQVWDLQTTNASMQQNTEQRLFKIVRMIAEKTSSIAKMKKFIDQNERELQQNYIQKPKTSAKAIMKKSLTSKQSARILPILGNKGVQGQLNIINEGEQNLLIYKQQVDQLSELKLQLQRIDTEINMQKANNQLAIIQLKRDVKKEMDVLERSIQQRNQIERQQQEFTKVMENHQQVNEQNCKLLESSKINQLEEERTQIQKELKEVDQQIKTIKIQNKKLFDAVGDKIQIVLKEFKRK